MIRETYLVGFGFTEQAALDLSDIGGEQTRKNTRT